MYGCIGLLIEVFFTGLHTVLFDRNYRATCQTYLWMLPIYGAAGTGLGYLHRLLDGVGFIVFATLFIYLVEFSTGWVLRHVLGRCPWDYGAARFGIMGLVRLDYLPFWLMVAIGFDSLCAWMDKALVVLQRV